MPEKSPKVNFNELHALENRVKVLINKSKENLANKGNVKEYGPRRPSSNLLAAIEHTAPAYVAPVPSSRPVTPVTVAPRPPSPRTLLTTGAPVTIGAVASHGGRTKKHRTKRARTAKKAKKTRKTRKTLRK